MKYLAYGDIINKTQQSLIGIVVVLIGFGAIGIAVNMAAAAARRGPATTSCGFGGSSA